MKKRYLRRSSFEDSTLMVSNLFSTDLKQQYPVRRAGTSLRSLLFSLKNFTNQISLSNFFTNYPQNKEKRIKIKNKLRKERSPVTICIPSSKSLPKKYCVFWHGYSVLMCRNYNILYPYWTAVVSNNYTVLLIS